MTVKLRISNPKYLQAKIIVVSPLDIRLVYKLKRKNLTVIQADGHCMESFNDKMH